jgi:hypothetical protein
MFWQAAKTLNASLARSNNLGPNLQNWGVGQKAKALIGKNARYLC